MSDHQRLCCYCYQYKLWLWDGKRLKDGSKVYVDDKQTRWAGKRCPDCERKRVRAALKCTPFERALIFAELQKQGFAIVTHKFPLKVHKDGKTFSVGFRYATTQGNRILLEDDGLQNSADLYMLIFASTRLVSKENVERLQPTPLSPPVELNPPILALQTGAELTT